MKLSNIEKLIFNGKKVSISSGYGRRTYVINGKTVTDFHYGWDLVYRKNGKLTSTTVYAINDGVVYKIGKDNVSGNYIYIKYPNLGIMLFYCHLKKIYLKKGQKVKEKDKVGLTGTTGNSTGIHLHLGVKIISSNLWVDPAYISLVKYNYLYAASKYLKVYSKKTLYALHFRKSPGLDEEVISIIPKNSEVIILKENYKKVDDLFWDKIKWNGKTGYAANEYMKLYESKATERLNIRLRAGTNKPIIKSIAKNKKVKVVREDVKKINGLYWDKIKI